MYVEQTKARGRKTQTDRQKCETVCIKLAYFTINCIRRLIFLYLRPKVKVTPLSHHSKNTVFIMHHPVGSSGHPRSIHPEAVYV